MPDRPRSSRPRDVNSLAAFIVSAATDEDKSDPADTRDPAAVALGRRGGLKGGRARADKLSPEQRSASAAKAAQARWSKPTA
jgi:hypothetical protein